MIIFSEILIIFAQISIGLVALKAMIGFHFPWEKCPCCGRRLDKYHKDTKNILVRREDLNHDMDDILKKWEKHDRELEKLLKKEKRKNGGA